MLILRYFSGFEILVFIDMDMAYYSLIWTTQYSIGPYTLCCTQIHTALLINRLYYVTLAPN